MDDTTSTRPADQPERASALGDDGEIDPDIAEARKRAGIALRQMTVASTMVYAGVGVRASERAKQPGAKKGTTARPRARSTAEPAAAAAPEPAPPDASPVSTTAAEAVRPSRKRLRTHSQFILRISETIAGQLDAIDAITRDPKRGEGGPGEAERHARTVAALARVSAELRKELEADRRRRADDDDSARDAGHSGVADRPRDLDELRERLSRRLEERHRSGPAVSVGDDAAGGDRLSD
jgi:hypothetical protein